MGNIFSAEDENVQIKIEDIDEEQQQQEDVKMNENENENENEENNKLKRKRDEDENEEEKDEEKDEEKEEKEEKEEEKEEPQKKKRRIEQQICCVLSGFRKDSNIYNLQQKRELQRKIVNLGGRVISTKSDTFTDEVTHILSPYSSRTMKVLYGIIQGKWIVTPEWIEHSFSNEKFLPESSFGFKISDNFLKDKTFCITESFKKFYPEITFESCKKVLEFAGSKITDKPEDSHFCLVAGPSPKQLKKKKDKKNERKVLQSKHPHLYICNWEEFLEMIFPPHMETILRKASLLKIEKKEDENNNNNNNDNDNENIENNIGEIKEENESIVKEEEKKVEEIIIKDEIKKVAEDAPQKKSEGVKLETTV